jgi:putative flippase GtrA
MTKKKSNKALLTRLIEYGITGGAWFWSGYIVFALLYSGLKWGIVPAKIISYLFGLSVNFILERFWVFGDARAKKQIQKVTVRYVILSAINLGIDTAIVWGLSKVGISPYIGQFISAGFFTVWNYIWYHLWVFAKKDKPGPKRPAAPQLHRSKHVRYAPKGHKK